MPYSEVTRSRARRLTIAFLREGPQVSLRAHERGYVRDIPILRLVPVPLEAASVTCSLSRLARNKERQNEKISHRRYADSRSSIKRQKRHRNA